MKIVYLMALFTALPSSINAESKCNDRDIQNNNISCFTFTSNEYPGYSPDINLSPNGLPTKIAFHNKGGYAARLLVSYTTNSLGGQDDLGITRTSSWIFVGQKTSFTLPSDARNTTVKTELRTGLVWRPVHRIEKMKVCTSKNIWEENSGLNNVFQINTWGTTFHPKWSIIQPEKTHRNNADETVQCK